MDSSFFHVLPALLPHAIAIRTFGYALVLNGYNAKKIEYRDVQSFVLSNYHSIWETYTEKVNSIFREVLINRNFDEFLQLIYLRDLSIVSYHCFLTISFFSISNKIRELFPNDDRLWTHFFSPLLDINRVHDALNGPTLKRYGAPKILERWVPIPVFLFDEKRLDSARLDTKNAPAGNNILRFTQSITEIRDFMSIYSWIQMLFTDSFIKALQANESKVLCPIWRWVRDQNDSIGKEKEKYTSKHLSSLCNDSLNITLELVQQKGKIYPSEQYCSVILDKYNLRNEVKCLFRHCIELYSLRN